MKSIIANVFTMSSENETGLFGINPDDSSLVVGIKVAMHLLAPLLLVLSMIYASPFLLYAVALSIGILCTPMVMSVYLIGGVTITLGQLSAEGMHSHALASTYILFLCLVIHMWHVARSSENN